MSEQIDIGHGVTISFYDARNPAGGEPMYVRAGLIEEHPSATSPTGRCNGAVYFRGRPGASEGQPAWEVVSEEPLTLSPSLLCRACGHHGWIRDGRWVPA